MGVGKVWWAPRISHRPSPSFDVPSGGHFFLGGAERGLGHTCTELPHEGPGSLSISSCGPALGWNQECSKE